jgi:hypothetical protein
MAFLLFDVRRDRSSLDGTSANKHSFVGLRALDGAFLSSPGNVPTEEPL